MAEKQAPSTGSSGRSTRRGRRDGSASADAEAAQKRDKPGTTKPAPDKTSAKAGGSRRPPKVGDSRPAPKAGDAKPAAAGKGGSRAADAQGDSGPAKPKIGDSRPAPRVGDSRPAPRVGDSRPAAKVGDSRPAAKVGDSRPAPTAADARLAADKGSSRSREDRADGGSSKPKVGDSKPAPNGSGGGSRRRRRRGGRGRGGAKSSAGAPVEAITEDKAVELDDATLKRRRGRTRKGQAVGRYLMCVHVGPHATQIATLEGRSLVEHQVSRPADDVSQIHGNIYMGRVQNVLPGMEAAFIDIGTPKNAVMYRGDVQYDPAEFEGTRGGERPRIEDMLVPGQSILCQVTKNPIAHKGARLGQEVSLPGRFVVMVPNSGVFGISKRLPESERKRLRGILEKVKPPEHGVIVRTAAESVTAEEIRRDVGRLLAQWEGVEKLAKQSKAPALLYREPEAAVRIIREEFTKHYRGVIIDDRALYEEIRGYVESVTPEMADRIEYYDPTAENLPLFERRHVEEQVRKALDPKVWLPSGGSLVIEHTEALTVIDVNTGKNVGRSSLEETVYKNNLEAAEAVAYQLRLRDIGGIIVIDFVDMEVAKHRDDVIGTFRAALARDKTRTQVSNISTLGLVEMTRKRIGEGLLDSVSTACDACDGQGRLTLAEVLQ